MEGSSTRIVSGSGFRQADDLTTPKPKTVTHKPHIITQKQTTKPTPKQPTIKDIVNRLSVLK
jgi:hypothetical protein